MTNYKTEALTKISNGDLEGALVDIRSNNINFVENDIAGHIDQIIRDNESGEYDIEAGVALLRHWHATSVTGSRAAVVKKHLGIVSLYNATATNDTISISDMSDEDVSYFDGQSPASTKSTFLNRFFQSNIDTNISASLKKFALDSNQKNAAITEFLTNHNDLVVLDGDGCAVEKVCSARKTKVFKSILDVYGGDVTTLEGDYADYFLVEAADILFMSNDATLDDIKLVQKLNRVEFLLGTTENYRALAKLIFNNTYKKYAGRSEWHEDKKDADGALLAALQVMSNAIKTLENQIATTHPSFKVLDPTEIDLEVFKDSSVAATAARAFDYEASAQYFKDKSQTDGDEFYEMNSYIKDASGTENPIAIHNAFHKSFRDVIFGIDGDLDAQAKQLKVKFLTETEKENTEKKIESLLSHFKTQHDVNLEDICIAFGKSGDSKIHITLDKEQGFPKFKTINDCNSFDETVVVEALTRHANQANPISEVTIKNHELGTVVLEYVSLFQPSLLGASEPALLDTQ